MTIDKRALREVAEKATPGTWRRTSSLFNGITVTPFSLCGEEVTLAHAVEKRDAEFIAAANPATVLALLDENIQLQRGKDALEAVALALRDDMRDARGKLEAAERLIAELERSETQLINERDSAESALNDVYKAVMGQAPEWSNWFSFADAIDEIDLACGLWRNQTEDVIQFRARIAELEARTVNLPKRSVGEVMHMSGFSRDYAEGWCSGNDNARHEIRAAGIKVKGA